MSVYIGKLRGFSSSAWSVLFWFGLSREVLWCTMMDAVESALNVRLSSLGGFSKEIK